MFGKYNIKNPATKADSLFDFTSNVVINYIAMNTLTVDLVHPLSRNAR